ncbi:MAG TPA: glycosyltransferase family 39 protein, partial [Pyrinomonadaceae bacterium]
MSGLEQTLVVADGRDSAETSARGLAAWAALFAVLALGAARDASLLWGSPLAVGVDGYYYVLQVTQITKTGRLFFPTRTPLMLYALAGIAGVSGGPVAAVKLAGVLLHALLCAGVAALVRRALRSPWLGVLAATLTAFSGLHLFMVSEFINNLGALTALVWSGYFALRRRQTRSARCAVAAATLFALAVVTHRSALPLTLAALASYLLFRWFAARAERGRFNWYALALAPFAYVVPALLAAQRLVRLPAWLAEGVSARPRSMFTEWFLADGSRLLLAAAAALLLLIKRRDSGVDSAGVNLVGAATAFAALVTFNPFLFSPGGVSSSAGRLRVVAYVQAALLVPGVVWLIRRSRPALVPYALAALLPLLLLSAQVREPTGLREEFLARREGLIRGL